MEVVKRYRGERRRYYSGGYMGQKRRELVRRVRYDAKNAAHLIRLLAHGDRVFNRRHDARRTC
jgi:hypothetical protein